MLSIISPYVAQNVVLATIGEIPPQWNLSHVGFAFKSHGHRCMPEPRSPGIGTSRRNVARAGEP